MTYDVRVTSVPAARPTVVAVDEVSDLAQVGEAILRLSRSAYAALDAAGIDGRHRGCNVALYSGSDPLVVEVGVELVGLAASPGLTGLADLSESLPADGRVRLSSLPEGPVAIALHQGPYQDLPAAHAAIRSWCAAAGLELAGPNWEVYGERNDDPAKLETEVAYLLVSR